MTAGNDAYKGWMNQEFQCLPATGQTVREVGSELRIVATMAARVPDFERLAGHCTHRQTLGEVSQCWNEGQ
jgi:hypothetical protein